MITEMNVSVNKTVYSGKISLYVSAKNENHLSFLLTQTTSTQAYRCRPCTYNVQTTLYSIIVAFDDTQKHITPGRTPLEMGSIGNRDVYLTTYKTLKRQLSMASRVSILQTSNRGTIGSNLRPSDHRYGLISGDQTNNKNTRGISFTILYHVTGLNRVEIENA